MIEIYFDGLCEPINPGGTATYGYVIIQDGTQIAEGSGLVGSGVGITYNIVEYEAILNAIKKYKELGLNDSILIKGDSSLVIKQLTGKWKSKSATSKKYVPVPFSGSAYIYFSSS
jgi:ribonuclease HI